MCNLSQGVFERGEAHGITIGEARGIGIGEARGKVQSQFENLLSIMKKLHLTFDAAADLLDIPTAERDTYRKLVEEKL